MDSTNNTLLCEGDIINLDKSVVVEEFLIEFESEIEVNTEKENNDITNNLYSEITDFGETIGEQICDDGNAITIAGKSNKTRKRKTNQKNWKRNVRQKQYQSGKSYVSSRGKVVPAKEIISKKNCFSKCKFNCEKNVTKAEREELFKTYYSLNQQGKLDYILRTTARTETNRKTNTSGVSRRNYSYEFFADINGNRIKVCKSYWLGTFAISQKPVYNAHNEKDIVTGTAKKNESGSKSIKRIPESKVLEIKAHINSFPAIESHYCRANSSKLYLDPNLNISKMYYLYKDKVDDPVKESFYRHVLNTNFNLDFHRPKSDRCGKCESFFVAEKEKLLTDEMIKDNEYHVNLKKMMREQKNIDKESGIPILTFDLENVLSCPRAEIGPMFYHSKLSIYNLTAHLSISKKIYCAIWTEYTGGRSGNDIASAFYKILEKVIEDNNITKLITWSDSCVPQNKNSIMTLAMQHFLKTHPDIESILMKYSLPGHSALQEVDNAHSQIEKHLCINEYFSPMGLIRLLKTVNSRKPFVIIQMQAGDFKDFSKYSKMCFNYKNVPFSTLKMLRLTQTQFEMEFSYDYIIENMQIINIRRNTATRVRKNKNILPIPILEEIESISTKNIICKEKEKHLKAMFKYMSAADIAYYKVILKLGD